MGGAIRYRFDYIITNDLDEDILCCLLQKITLNELKEMSTKMFGSLVKAVVGIEKEIMVVDAGMHADQEQFLLDERSEQEYLWGINLYPERFPFDNWVVFDSMINMRPSYGNRTRGVENLEIQQKIRNIVNKLVRS
ncbi:MAG: DUF5674 family protein [Candidatus Babeliales bacterium]